MLLVNILILVIGPFVLYSIDVELYRLLVPYIGRLFTTIAQAIFSIAAVLAWIYFWRKSFIMLFETLLRQKSKATIHS